VSTERVYQLEEIRVIVETSTEEENIAGNKIYLLMMKGVLR
jgi:hypothetical protein